MTCVAYEALPESCRCEPTRIAPRLRQSQSSTTIDRPKHRSRSLTAHHRSLGRMDTVLVDTQGLLMDAIVHAAGIQDRDGSVLLMTTLFGLYPFLLKLYADAGYQGPTFQKGLARACRAVNVEIVRRCDTSKFVVSPSPAFQRLRHRKLYRLCTSAGLWNAPSAG